MQTFLVPSIFAALVSTVIFMVMRRKKPHPLEYPPGPPPKPIVGNAFDIPSEKPWLTYSYWSKQFNSDIIHLTAMNTHIVVLHKMEDVIALMEKRSAIYSSRPTLPISELLGVESLTAMLPYENLWRKQRKIFQECLRKQVVPRYRHILIEKVHLTLELLLCDYSKFREHCKWLGIAITMTSTFGYDLMPGEMNYRFVQLAERAITAISEFFRPESTLINVVPFLRHIPPWFPGASTQRFAAEIKKTTTAYKNEPFEFVKKNLAAGTSKECLLADLLRRRDNSNEKLEDENTLKDTISTIYLASIETMHSAQLIFLMTMAFHPLEQKRAQDEIDRVIGSDRLPTFDDRASLPYVEALLREVLRWRLISPFALPHATVKDDVYKGFYIPKDTIVLSNTWAISRDEMKYPDPELFRPERFFNADGSLNDDNMEYIFGFGRRICPGRYLAGDVVWLMVVSVLSTFNISKAKDEMGAEIDIDSNAFTTGTICLPQPFKCFIVPRSPQAEMLIRSAASIAKENIRIS